MSKANSSGMTPDSEIRRLYSQFVHSLPSSTFEDKKGYNLRRQLTTSEQQRFFNSLPESLQNHINLQRVRHGVADNEEYDPRTWDDEEELREANEPVDEEDTRDRPTDLLSYNDRFMNLDIAEIPQDILDSLSEERLRQLTSAPSFRAREELWERKPRGKRNRQPPTESQRFQAISHLFGSYQQLKKIREYLNRPIVTEVIIRRVYFDKYPGTWKGYEKR